MTVSKEMTPSGFGLFREARGLVKEEFNEVLKLSDDDWADVLSACAKMSKNDRLKAISDDLIAR